MAQDGPPGRLSELPPNFGQLLALLFPTSKRGGVTPSSNLCMESFHKYMVSEPKHRYNLLVLPERRDKREGGPMAYNTFTQKVQRICDGQDAYVDHAGALRPLHDFYRHIAWRYRTGATSVDEAPVTAEEAATASSNLRYLERCLRYRLPEEATGRPYAMLPISADLSYVITPENYPWSQGDVWRTRSMNGDSGLYYRSAQLFEWEHMRHLAIHSPLPVVYLAIQVARASIAFADYELAAKICAELLSGAKDKIKGRSLDLPRLDLLLQAARVSADANSYTIVEHSWPQLAKTFDEASALTRLAMRHHPEFGASAFRKSERDLLQVRVRAYSRARLLYSLFGKDKDDLPPQADQMVLDLQSALYELEFDSPPNEPYKSRYVHWDSLCRGLALLVDKDDHAALRDARALFAGDWLPSHPERLRERFPKGLQNAEGFQGPGEGTQGFNLHGDYRKNVTAIMLAIREADLDQPLVEANGPKGRTGRRSESALKDARSKLLEARGLVDGHRMLHGQIELALLSAKLLQLGA